MLYDTISAISTAVSPAGIGIVRLSGPDSLKIASKIFEGKKSLESITSHTLRYGHIKDQDTIIDEVLLSYMKGPHSYTGEDVIEINCHGGVLPVTRVLELTYQHGARPAEPGEFTKRAFLNGRMDLSQAEAVMDVISSQNEYALQNSVSQLSGSLKKQISEIRNRIIYNTAFIESALDDPEHVSLDGFSDALYQELDLLSDQLSHMISSAENGRIIKEGIQTVIVGKPNVGKSTLLNTLAGRERAIVTDIAGTTRDALEEHIRIQGLSLNVIDTAGIRFTEDVVEKIGVERAKEYADSSDLILYIVDSSRDLDSNDEEIIQLLQGRRFIVLMNKSDLEQITTKDTLMQLLHTHQHSQAIPILDISAKEEEGIQEFQDLLLSMFIQGEISFDEGSCITNTRQKYAIMEAYQSIQLVKQAIEDGMPEDFYTIDMMTAYDQLGQITGETVGEDLVNEIFSKFCTGK